MSQRLAFLCLAACLTACGIVPPSGPSSSGDGGEAEADAGTADAGSASRCDFDNVYRSFSRTEQLRELEGCRELKGNLVIASSSSSPEEIDLSPLAGLEEVSGYVYVRHPWLTTLDGLHSLRRIGDSLTIESNDRLIRVDGLRALEFVGGDVLVYGNPAIERFEGWNALTFVGGDLSLEVSAPEGIEGLERLQRVGFMRIGTTQETFEGPPALTQMRGFEVRRTMGLKRLKGFGQVKALESLLLMENQDLLEVDVFAGLTTLGELTIAENRNLTSLKGLNQVEQVEKGTIVLNPQIRQFEALGSLRSVKKNLRLEDLTLLPRLESLHRLEEVDRLYLWGIGVADLEDFSSLTRVDKLFIHDNRALTSLRGLDALRSPGSSFSVGLNSSLPTCEAEALLRRFREQGFSGSGQIFSNGPDTCP